jgi:hypothetical protein
MKAGSRAPSRFVQIEYLHQRRWGLLHTHRKAGRASEAGYVTNSLDAKRDDVMTAPQRHSLILTVEFMNDFI